MVRDASRVKAKVRVRAKARAGNRGASRAHSTGAVPVAAPVHVSAMEHMAAVTAIRIPAAETSARSITILIREITRRAEALRFSQTILPFHLSAIMTTAC